MASSEYWKQQLDALKRPVYDSGNYVNKSFVDRIKEAQDNIDNLVSAEEQANSKMQASQDAYDTFKGEMRHYSEISDEQENKFGVKTAMDNYNQSKDAIAATQNAIDVLPSSINANSNRILTQSQRMAAYQAEYSVLERKMSRQSAASSTYEKVWEKARKGAMEETAAEYAGQQQTLSVFDKAWTAAINNWTTAKANVLKAKQERSDIESQYRTWQRQQYDTELYNYMKESDRLNKLYIGMLENETAMRIAEIQSATNRALADSQIELAKKQAETHNRYSALMYAAGKLSDWYKKEYSNSIILNSML